MGDGLEDRGAFGVEKRGRGLVASCGEALPDGAAGWLACPGPCVPVGPADGESLGVPEPVPDELPDGLGDGGEELGVGVLLGDVDPDADGDPLGDGLAAPDARQLGDELADKLPPWLIRPPVP